MRQKAHSQLLPLEVSSLVLQESDIRLLFGASKVTPCIKTSVAHPEDLSSVPRIYMMNRMEQNRTEQKGREGAFDSTWVGVYHA